MKSNNFIKNKLIPFLLTSAFVVSSDITNDIYTSICSAAERGIHTGKRFNRKANGNIKNNTHKKIDKIINKNISKKSNKEEENNVLKYNFSEWNKKEWNKETGNLIVINRNNEVPQDLDLALEPIGKKEDGKKVGKQMRKDLCKMIYDAQNNIEIINGKIVKKPIKLWVCSGYRSIKRQTKLFNDQVEREKKRKSKNPEQDASKVVAKPRQSEHNIGLAVDINCVDPQFKNQKEYEWLKQHAQDYGFIERYQEGWEEKTGCIPEPWHWRYVGVDNAKEIKKSGKCLEEFVIDKIEIDKIEIDKIKTDKTKNRS